MDEGIRIIVFTPEYESEFARLNYQWIEEHFVVEDHDREMLDHPQDYIIDNGGQIFFAMMGNRVAGTVALINEGEASFELAKMAVSPEFRGKGIGDLLIEACCEFARQAGKQNIFLLSNTKLSPALNLYRKHGFMEIHHDQRSPYERVDIMMQLDL